MSVERKQRLTEKQLSILESEMQKRRKSVALAYVLLILLGGLGVHKFYLGKTSQGVKYLVLAVASWLLGVGSVFMGFIAGAFGGESAGVAGFGLSILVGIVFSIILGCFLLYDLFTLPSQVNDVNEEMENQVIDQIITTSTSEPQPGSSAQ